MGKLQNTIKINKSQEVSPLPAGDHQAAMNRRESMRNTKHKNTNHAQKKYRLGRGENNGNPDLECKNGVARMLLPRLMSVVDVVFTLMNQ